MSDANGMALELNGVGKSFPGVRALNNVSFGIRRNEIHALCGENGAGKSTLINIISGVWPAGTYDGEVRIDGRPVRFSGVADAESAGIAVIHQELALVPEMTVAENIFLGAEPVRHGRINWDDVYSRTARLLEEYSLDLGPATPVADLGVGRRQLVEIAKALSKDSRILLLDEPTAALTETEVGILLDILRDLRRRGMTCLYITHKLDEVFAIADRITVLRDGESVATLEASDCDRKTVIRHMVGREITTLFPRQSTDVADEVLLEVDGLTVRHENAPRPVLEDICFTVRAGEILGIGGLMGAGRSELLMHLFGAFGERVSGEVRVQGRPLSIRSPNDAIRRGLMLVTEDRKRSGLVLGQSVAFNLSLAALDRFATGPFVDENAEIQHNQEMFDSLDIKAPGLETAVAALSGGNQQKVVIGKALMTEPIVIFLDEPTRGVDVGARQEVYRLMNRITASGKAVVMVSSDLPELMGMSDRMLILSEGRIGGEFTRSNATQEAVLAAAMAFHPTPDALETVA